MSKEEKKAIETIEELLRSDVPICEYMLKHQEIDAMRTLLKIIEKQQKEIEHLKIEKEVDYISKEKIREKMKEIEEIQKMSFTDIGEAVFNGEIVLLKRLLEE